ncbi:MAG: exodeoxyribonuclease VII large subunit [Candidatus Kerfeldbacteria bacterium]|nr:exodeoxyribonuclease VII large subunit [Candidatus Kerfeldbacteria bacterium]
MPKVLTVSQFVEAIRGLLRETLPLVTVQGEVTGYRTRRDNLIYFELKDSAARALCFGLSHEIRTVLEDGMEIRVTGSPSLFKQSGGFHLRVVAVELVGEGALRKAFEALRRKLEAEGLFREERKRPLLEFPETVGVVTSPDAAAWTDVQRILRNRWPLINIKLAAVAVQGAGAARQIVKALDHFSTSGDVDAVILTRGGGSLEDLQTFNDELVARAIYASRVPVVVGVGHERDVTIADLVADVRASTPSNAAERVVPDRAEVLHRLDVMAGRLARAVAGMIEVEGNLLGEQARRLGSAITQLTSAVHLARQRFGGAALIMSQRIARVAAELGHVSSRLSYALETLIVDRRTRTTKLMSLLQTLSPLAILKRGYSITSHPDGRIVKRSRELTRGQTIRTRLGVGRATSTVTSAP